ncbi:thiamine-repressible mitochondrial transport protein THI74 [Pseudohyphozyma bogoriensis]|nr:thiamine-repressible mitochondrial transport protein THI74 [Pseudohyphozyma bogoriensis]
MSSPSSSNDHKVKSKRGRYFLGTLMLLGVVLLWVSTMFTDMDYNKPFLITYLCTATFSLYLIRPGFTQLQKIRREGLQSYTEGLANKTSADLGGGTYQSVGTFDVDEAPAFSRPEVSISPEDESVASVPVIPEEPLTIKETASLALLFCGIWFIANWTINAAMGYTSVSSATILSSMSGFFTLAVGAAVGVDEFTLAKLSSVAISVLGVLIVSKGDHDLPSLPGEDNTRLPIAPLLGDALALGSALAYAFYVILLKVRIKNENRVSMTLFFGFVGLFNIVLIWPMGFVLHWAKIEVWEWPHGGKLWLSIGINAAITFISDALYLRAMLLTSPLAVTLGISLTIPIAMVGDLYRGTEKTGWMGYVGGLLVLGSFLANGLMDLAQAEEENTVGVQSVPASRRPSQEVLLGSEEGRMRNGAVNAAG